VTVVDAPIRPDVFGVALSSGLIAKGQNGDEMVDFDFQFYSVAIVKDLTYHHHY